MSLRLAILLLVAVLAFSTEAAIPARTLLHEEHCEEACEAAQENDPDEIRELIDEPHEICDCECNYERWTPMHVAARYNCLECFEHMLTAPSNCAKDVTNEAGDTAMHIAVKGCLLDAVEELIEWGFSVNVTNSDGDTPLCIASRQDNSDCGQIVRQAIANGAEMCITCSDGETPCEGCVKRGVCDILEEDGACDCP